VRHTGRQAEPLPLPASHGILPLQDPRLQREKRRVRYGLPGTPGGPRRNTNEQCSIAS
jgi:hypothetical protein